MEGFDTEKRTDLFSSASAQQGAPVDVVIASGKAFQGSRGT